MPMTRLIIVIALMLPAGVSLAQGDPFEQIKAAMAKAACCRFEFISIVESEVFESVDSTDGSALLAADGRYLIKIGGDEYLRTADRLYSYSRDENQVTVEKVDRANVSDETVSFITRFDKYYRTLSRKLGSEYLLIRLDSASRLPDSVTVNVSGKKPQLESLEYLDDNGDFNRIVFRLREYESACDERLLSPHFSDSVEVIELF
jgi:outer membrane lipoprotein-sorting protein